MPLLLYRGSAEVGKTHSVMPHRKWRMEFQTDQFPDYDRWMTPGSAPLYQAYTLTERFELPGTSEEVQLFLLPLRGRDGTMYGLCGFEISESYFKQNFAQPTGFDRLSCLLAPAGDGLAADAALSSGTTGGYYQAPRDTLMLRSMGGGLTQLTGPDSDYAGIPTLTKTERRIFDGYAAGLRTREIAQQLDIKDSTLRFHNKNIYDKLGVSSLKQLQQFVAILNSGSGSTPDESGPRRPAEWNVPAPLPQTPLLEIGLKWW